MDYQVFRTCVTIRTRSRRAGLKIFRGVVVTTYSRPVCNTFGTSWPQDVSRIIKYSRPICAAIRTRSRRAGFKMIYLKISRIIKYSRPICATIRTRSRRAGLKIDILKISRIIKYSRHLRYDKDTFETSWPQDRYTSIPVETWLIIKTRRRSESD